MAIEEDDDAEYAFMANVIVDDEIEMESCLGVLGIEVQPIIVVAVNSDEITIRGEVTWVHESETKTLAKPARYAKLQDARAASAVAECIKVLDEISTERVLKDN